MKKIFISSAIIILALIVFNFNKINNLESSGTCAAMRNYKGSIKSIKAVQCANMTCHNSGSCTKNSAEIAMLSY